MKISKKILVAHHDPSMRRRMVMLFAASGFDVRPFESIETALEGARAEWFDLAVVDGSLPAMEGVDLMASLRGVQPTLQVLMMVEKLDLGQIVQGIRQGAAEVVAVADDPAPVLRQVMAFFRLEESEGGKTALAADELSHLEASLEKCDPSDGEAGEGAPDLERKLLQLIAENRSLAARSVRLQEEKDGLEAELRALVSQGADVQRVQGELETIRQERELAATTQLAIDEKARALGELRAKLASERSALECERQRAVNEAAPKTEAGLELAQVRAELDDWRRRLEQEDDRLASDSARVRQESLHLARERRRFHEDLELIRTQEDNLRVYEARLREMQGALETERVKWSGVAHIGGFGRDHAEEPGLRDAWSKVQRAGELLEAERKNFLDDRLNLRELERMVKEREEKVRDREIRQSMRESAAFQMPSADSNPSTISRLKSAPGVVFKNLTRAPYEAVRMAFGANEQH